MSDDKVVAVKSEVQRLLDATIIRKVMYPKWLANTVPIKKKNGKWRMCVNFTDLNKATPKDNYPLPRMDQVVDSAANAAIMSLLDCFSGYHQCWMAKEDEEKTSFITKNAECLWIASLDITSASISPVLEPSARPNTRRIEKRRLNIHQNDWDRVQATDRQEHTGLCRRPHRQEFQPGQPRKRFG
jgi:hypothetical protein